MAASASTAAASRAGARFLLTAGAGTVTMVGGAKPLDLCPSIETGGDGGASGGRCCLLATKVGGFRSNCCTV